MTIDMKNKVASAGLTTGRFSWQSAARSSPLRCWL